MIQCDVPGRPHSLQASLPAGSQPCRLVTPRGFQSPGNVFQGLSPEPGPKPPAALYTCLLPRQALPASPRDSTNPKPSHERPAGAVLSRKSQLGSSPSHQNTELKNSLSTLPSVYGGTSIGSHHIFMFGKL